MNLLQINLSNCTQISGRLQIAATNPTQGSIGIFNVNIRQHHRLGKKVRDTDEEILYNLLHGEYTALPIQQIKAAYEQQY